MDLFHFGGFAVKILILGAGGVGGYLGARFIQKGQQVEFLLRPNTAAVVQRSGLSLRSPLGDWSGSGDIADTQSGPFDLVILSCKAFDLDAALQDVRPFIQRGTYILPLLNGVQHLDRISQALPDARLLGGVAHIGATIEGPGKIVHLNRLATFLAGPLQNGAPIPNQLSKLFAETDGDELTMQLVDNASHHMWTKLVFLATLAASTCLHDADIGTILMRPDGKQLILNLLHEAQRISASEGFDLPAGDLTRYREQLTEPGSTATASMLRDMRAARSTEVEYILGDLVGRAIRNNIETPNLVAALLHVRAYEQKRASA